MDGRRAAPGAAVTTRHLIRTPGYLVTLWTWMLLFSGVALGAVLDPEVQATWSRGTLVAVVSPLVCAVWSLRLGVVVDRDEVRIRNWFRTIRIPVESIRYVRPAQYDGFFAPGGTWFPSTVTVEAGGRTVTAYCLVTTPRRAHRLAVRLQELVAACVRPGEASTRPVRTVGRRTA